MDQELVELVDDPDPSESHASWWSRYSLSMQESALTSSAREVIGLDAQYITHQCVFGAGAPSSSTNSWPDPRVRRGLVLGSVQSGKTASMLAVSALALDRGVNLLVMLTGTRLALWRQTISRTLAQLDRWTEEEDSRRRRERIMLPAPRLVARGRGAVPLENLYHEQLGTVRRRLVQDKPLVALVMKHPDHLIRFASFLARAVTFSTKSLNRPLHLLVMDDEADDGSILDAQVEAGLEADSDALKQIPRHIARIWAADGPASTTFDRALYATYVAYTATPQANFLQSDHNPLSPREFVAALRTPGSCGSVTPPRSITYEEPNGARHYYTGGACFYGELSDGDGRLCVQHSPPERNEHETEDALQAAIQAKRAEMLGDALRSYLVAGAARLLQSGRRFSTTVAMGPAPLAELSKVAPAPHSMLVHPSSQIDDQVFGAQLVAAWSAGLPIDTDVITDFPANEDGWPALSSDGLASRLEAEEDLWRDWLESFAATWDRLALLPGDRPHPRIGVERWSDVHQLLRDEIFPHVRLSVINSHPMADDRPQFEPDLQPDGTCLPARDLMTIFVSGNVMARGLTLEGLTTTVFVRDSKAPAADTQSQMQRWFGYRGAYLEWCRIFLFSDQFRLFRAYQANDEALRSEVVTAMNQTPDSAPTPLVLQGAGFKATNKIANLRALPLCPGAQPFIRIIDSGECAATNASLLADLINEGEWHPLSVAGRKRGLIRKEPVDLLAAAEILERFRYSHHDPDPDGLKHQRWKSLEQTLALRTPEAPLFRPPGTLPSRQERVPPTQCPYSIAAYLRLWNAALYHKAPGLFPTDDRDLPWTNINISQYKSDRPSVYLGVRFGDAGDTEDDRLRAHGIKAMTRQVVDDTVISTWGSRNPGHGSDPYLGDHLFDYHHHKLEPPAPRPGEPAWRPRGAPALILFHVIRTERQDAITAGLAIPLGGPDHFAALRSGPSDGTRR